MNDSTMPLIEHLRPVDELVFLNWETFEEDLMRRILRSSIGMVDEATNVPELKQSSQEGGSKRAGPVAPTDPSTKELCKQ